MYPNSQPEICEERVQPCSNCRNVNFRSQSHNEGSDDPIRKCSNIWTTEYNQSPRHSRTSSSSATQSGRNKHFQSLTEAIHFPRNATCKCLQKFHIFLNKMFFKMGCLIANHPSYFIIIPVFITLLGLTGLQQMTYEKDPEYLFSPANGEGAMTKIVIENLFPINYSAHFDPSRLTRLSPFGIIFASAKDGGSMFRVEVFNEVVALDQAVQNLTIEWQEDVYNYTDICAKINNNCIDNPVLQLAEFMPDIEAGTMQLNYPVMLYPLIFPFYFGGPTVNESEGIVTATKAVSLTYFFKDDDWKQKQRSHIFEGRLIEYFKKTDFEHIKVDRFVSRTLTDELDNNARSITPYVGLTLALMISLSIGSGILSDWVRSKLSVGIFGILAAIFGTICAFGFLMYCQVPFIGINMVAPFLMLGIGIDNMFVILSAWHRTLPQEKVSIRMGKTYSEAAMSITITSLTNMLSFFSGTVTPFLAVRIFCLYTGLCILFGYIFCITFFGGCLAVAGHQEKKRRHTITCKPVLSSSEAADLGWCYRFWCAGGINPKDPWNPDDNKTPVLMNFFRDKVAKAINRPIIKLLVLVLFFMYIGGAIFGLTNLKEGLERKRLARDDSYMVDFFETEDKWFRVYPYRLQVVINEKLNYSDPETRLELEKLQRDFEKCKSVGPRIFTQSWMRGFYKYIDRRPELKKNVTDEESFIEILKSEYLVPTTPEYLDVKFNDDGTEILASRFIVQGYNIKDTNADKDMVIELRKVAAESKFKVLVYHPFFVFFDQYMMVKSTCLQTVAFDALVMVAVSLVFIPHPLCSLWVAFSIISIEFGVIGYMSLWGVSLDSISMINLIMCVGFSVDFSAHISYAYLTAHAKTPAYKVEECLYNLGLPFLQGGLSTILGVLVLIIAPSYIFTTFFKIVFLVILFGFLHGTILLPVFLSILGPGVCSKVEEDESTFEHPNSLSTSRGEKKNSIDIPKTELNYMDRESLERDLGLGSSGTSSQCSSLHEVNSVEGDSRKASSESFPAERSNAAFIPDEEEDFVSVRL